MKANEPIPLLPHEQQLFDRICWDIIEFANLDGETWSAQLDMAARLAESLLGRDAIPSIRMAYFIDPEMNAGGRGWSRKAIFERNFSRGREILRHPHFLPILRYFICGPELPEETVKRLRLAVAECRRERWALHRRLRALVRNEIRTQGFSPRHFGNQLFQAAHELRFHNLARLLRSAALAFRG